MTRSSQILVTVALAIVASSAQAQGLWKSDSKVSDRDFQCMANELYARTAGAEIDLVEQNAWLLKNRKDSAEFPSDYCELVGEDSLPPWEKIDLQALLQTISTSQRGSDALNGALAQLTQYHESLKGYQLSQVVAFKLLGGWLTDDPTEGRTSLQEPDEEPAEDEAGA